MDAVLGHDKNQSLVEPKWPECDVIVGNPPFLGDKKMRDTLGDKYVDDLRQLYKERVPGGSDLVCYWFEKARAMIESGKTGRVGLLATQGIRGGTNRKVLDQIKMSGDIFWGESDRNWILDGANVHVSMIAFDNGSEKQRHLNGNIVSKINSDLTSTQADLTTASALEENKGIAFIGTQKGGKFELNPAVARKMLVSRTNPNGRSNSDVIKLWANASDIAGRQRSKWIIDFGTEMSRRDAACYELPFEYLVHNVKQKRLAFVGRDHSNESWWLHQRPRPEMRNALRGRFRFIATPRHSKHRLFVWLSKNIVPDSALVVIARDDDYFFGVLHSRVHELWSRRKGTQVREAESGFRYTPSSTFETFAFPWPPGSEPTDEQHLKSIASAARNLVVKRDAWLKPSGASSAELEQRTLTKLYNQNPTWLKDAHRDLDEVVLAAYGWSKNLSDDEILTRLLQLNAQRFATQQGQARLKSTKEVTTTEKLPKKVPVSVRGPREKKRRSSLH